MKELTKSIRPLCFENNFEGYEYSIAGSSFIFTYKGEIYVTAAHHSVKNWEPEQILIPYHLESSKFLPIISIIRIDTSEIEDTDHKDFAVFKVWKDELDESEFRNNEVFNVNSPHNQGTFNTVLAAGFPCELNFVDYEKQKIIWQPCYLPGKQANCDFLGLKKINFKDNDLNDFDGLSGGAVFGFNGVPNIQAHNATWLGIVLRASRSSMTGFFVESKIIINAIELDIAARA